MKQIKLNNVNKKLVAFSLVLCAFVALVALFMVHQRWGSATHVMEMALTVMAIVVSSACCVHLFHQHQQWFKNETKLKTWLIHQLEQQSLGTLNQKMLSIYLESSLEKCGSVQKRLYRLQYYKKSNMARNKLINSIRRQQASQAVLEELGLHWY